MNVPFVWWLLLVVAQIISLVHANWITGEEKKKMTFSFRRTESDVGRFYFIGNLCWSMPCLNGGSCFGSAYTYLCVCPINYSGALCEKRLGKNERFVFIENHRHRFIRCRYLSRKSVW